MTTTHPVEADGAAAVPAATELALRLQVLLRSVNREIARRAGEAPSAAFVCECGDRGCAEAVEVPVSVFRAVQDVERYLVVRPAHEDPLLERVLRRAAGYLVVERTAG